jgi:hypothetical protein
VIARQHRAETDFAPLTLSSHTWPVKMIKLLLGYLSLHFESRLKALA